MNDNYLNISKNILRRRLMLLIGMFVIIIFNAAFFTINYLIKGNEILYTVLSAVILVALIVYLVFYIVKGQKMMFNSLYKLGRLVFLLPVVFYALLSVFEYINFNVINYEFIGYTVLSLAMQLITFRFNLKDKDPLKINNKCVISGLVGVFLFPIFIGLCFATKLDISVLDMSRTVRYELNSSNNLSITGVYNGLSSTIKIKDEYFGQKVTEINTGAFNNELTDSELTLYVTENIETINANALEGVSYVYFYGAPHLKTNSLKNVLEITFLNEDKIATAEYNFYQGNIINVSRVMIDEYRQDSSFNVFDVRPIIEDNEVYINFNTDKEYINTLIMNKGQKINLDHLKQSTDSAYTIYNDTVGYQPTQEYYQSRYENELQVLPGWIDSNSRARVDLNQSINQSMDISPDYEDIKTFNINYLSDSSKDNVLIYLSKSINYTLPEFNIAKDNRSDYASFEDSINYSVNSYGNTSTVEPGTVLDIEYEGYTFYANWTLKAPTSSFNYENLSGGTVDFVDGSTVEVSKIYDKVDLVLSVTGNHSNVELYDSSYNHVWYSTTNDITADSISLKTAGTYQYTVLTTITYTDEYGMQHNSNVQKEVEVVINKADTTVSFNFEGNSYYDNPVINELTTIYDSTKHELSNVSINRDSQDISDDKPQPTVTYSYTGNNSSAQYKVANVSSGTTLATITVPETLNYKSLEYEVTINVAKREVEVTLNEDLLTSIYGDNLSVGYTTLSAHQIESQNTNSGLITGEDLGVKYVCNVTPTSNISTSTNKYEINPAITNQNYLLVDNQSSYYTLNARKINLTISGFDTKYGNFFKSNYNNLISNLNYTSARADGLAGVGVLDEDLNSFTLKVDELLNYNLSSNYYNQGSYQISFDVVNSNYEIMNTYANSVNIDKRDIQYNYNNTKELVYSGKAQAPSIVISNILSGDDVTLTIDTAQYNSNINVNSYTITLSGAQISNDNYRFKESDEITYSIIKKTLTATVRNHDLIYGDDQGNSGVSFSGFVSGEDESDLTLSNLVYNYGGYKKYSNIGTYTISVSGNLNDNYDLKSVNATLTVSPLEVDVQWDVKNYTYNKENQYPTATILGLVNGDVVKVTKYSGYGSTAGEHTVLVSEIDSANYVISSSTKSKLYTINKKDISLDWSDLSLTYNATIQKPKAVFAEELISGDTSTITISGGQKNAGSYEAVATISNPNYNVTNSTSSYVINKYKLEYVWSNLEYTYDGKTHNPTVTLKNNVFAGDTSTITLSQAQKNKGHYTVIATINVNEDNYIIPTNNENTLIINPLELTYRVNGSTLYAGSQVAPNLVFTNLIGTDVVNVTSYSNLGVNVGEYEATINGIDNNNYVLPSDITVNYTISPIQIAVKWTGTTYEYSSIEYAPEASLTTGVLDGDSVILTVTGEKTNVGKYQATVSSSNSNYQITNPTCSFEITKAPLQINWKNNLFEFNKTSQAPSATAGLGVLGTDEIVVTVSGAKVDAGKYQATASINSNNYEISNPTYNFEITKKDVELVWFNFTFEYDGNSHAPTVGNAIGTVGSDILSVNIDGEQTNHGTYTATATTRDNNYNITNPTCEFEITKKNVTLTWENTTLEYNGSTQAPKASVAGISVAVIVSGGQTNHGTYQATATINNDNYVILNPTCEFEITKKNVTLTWENTTLEYNGSTQAPKASVSGLSVAVIVSGGQTNHGTYQATATINNDNYVILNPTSEFEITKKNVTLTWENTTLEYNGSTQAPKASVAGLLVEVIVTGGKVDAGIYQATASIDNDNYVISNPTCEFEITKRKISITINDLSSNEGESLKELTYKVNNGEIVNSDISLFVLKTNANSSNPGTYDITLKNSEFKNYEITISNPNNKGIYTVIEVVEDVE